MKKRIPLSVLGCTAASLIIPFIPSRRGGNGLMEYIDYPYAVLFNIVLLFAIYCIGYKISKDKIKAKMNKLELEKNVLDPSKRKL